MEKELPDPNLSEPSQVVSPESVRNLAEPSLESNVVTGTTEKLNQAGIVQHYIDEIDAYIVRQQIDAKAVIDTPSEAVNEYLRILYNLSNESQQICFGTGVVDDWFRSVFFQWEAEVSEFEVPPNPSELEAVVTHMKRYLESLTNQDVSSGVGIELLLDANCWGESADLMYSLGQAMGIENNDWIQFITEARGEVRVSLQFDGIEESTDELKSLSRLSELVGLGPEQTLE